jgi:hypothetical protein
MDFERANDGNWILGGVGVAILNFAGPTLAQLGDEEQQRAADRGADDHAGGSGTKMDTELRNQEVASKSANSSDCYIAASAARPTNTETFHR